MNKNPIIYRHTCSRCGFWDKKNVSLVSDGVDCNYLCYTHIRDFRIGCERILPRVKEVEGLKKFAKEKEFVKYLWEIENSLLSAKKIQIF